MARRCGKGPRSVTPCAQMEMRRGLGAAGVGGAARRPPARGVIAGARLLPGPASMLSECTSNTGITAWITYTSMIASSSSSGTPSKASRLARCAVCAASGKRRTHWPRRQCVAPHASGGGELHRPCARNFVVSSPPVLGAVAVGESRKKSILLASRVSATAPACAPATFSAAAPAPACAATTALHRSNVTRRAPA